MFDVTIIIPIYCRTEEALHWYEECLESALIQDCEVVVYDDASPIPVTQSSLKPHQLIVGQVRQGVSNARNQAAAAASKTLLLPLDGDDTLKPGAVKRLLDFWDGETPVYPDVAKFGTVDVPHYNLLDFDCAHIINHVGFTSVNVLHTKKQWELVGGWDYSLAFYEDGLYNAMLFTRWCAKRCPEPLVNYRQHPDQRTVLYKMESAKYAKSVLTRIRSLEMACSTCSNRKTRMQTVASQTAPVVNQKVDPSTLPGSMGGRVLSQYLGGYGKGKHYYQGPVTKFNYRVVYGEYIYADPKDTRSESETSSKSNFMLVRVENKAAPEPQTVVAPIVTSDVVVEELPADPRRPVKSKTKKPVE